MRIFLTIILAMILFSGFILPVLAAYEVAVKLPTQQAPSGESPSTIQGYIKTIYNFSLYLGGFLAMGMIVWGAILIAVSGENPSQRTEGMERIRGAIFGLLLLLGAFLILSTIRGDELVALKPLEIDRARVELDESIRLNNELDRAYGGAQSRIESTRAAAELAAIYRQDSSIENRLAWLRAEQQATQELLDSQNAAFEVTQDFFLDGVRGLRDNGENAEADQLVADRNSFSNQIESTRQNLERIQGQLTEAEAEAQSENNQ